MRLKGANKGNGHLTVQSWLALLEADNRRVHRVHAADSLALFLKLSLCLLRRGCHHRHPCSWPNVARCLAHCTAAVLEPRQFVKPTVSQSQSESRTADTPDPITRCCFNTEHAGASSKRLIRGIAALKAGGVHRSESHRHHGQIVHRRASVRSGWSSLRR